MGCPFLFYVATLYAMLMGYVSLLRGKLGWKKSPPHPLSIASLGLHKLGPLGVVARITPG